MATFKHISSKNANYGAAEQYLTFEHDEFTMKPTLDKNEQIIPRTGYLISSLNCGGEDFAIACMRSNLKYGKNQKREDVKSHHYIISFDPRDAPDNGLTVDRAQALGEEFCKTHFPGHQAITSIHTGYMIRAPTFRRSTQRQEPHPLQLNTAAPQNLRSAGTAAFTRGRFFCAAAYADRLLSACRTAADAAERIFPPNRNDKTPSSPGNRIFTGVRGFCR